MVPMIHLRTNADIVIQTLKQYRYKPDASNTTHAHFYHLNLLGIFLEHENLDYSREVADIWAKDLCVRFCGKTRVKAFRQVHLL